MTLNNSSLVLSINSLFKSLIERKFMKGRCQLMRIPKWIKIGFVVASTFWLLGCYHGLNGQLKKSDHQDTNSSNDNKTLFFLRVI